VATGRGTVTMTPAESARLLLLVRVICPTGDGSPLDWHRVLANLTAREALTAAIQLARRRSDVTAQDVRAEALAMRGDQPVDPAGPPAGTAWRVACPWCGAAVGAPCTVRGSDLRLRRAPAHPLRLAAADLVGFVESGSGQRGGQVVMARVPLDAGGAVRAAHQEL
jgi:hypothetical protein